MTLVVVQWAVPLLGALALMRLWKEEIPRERLMKALAWAAGVVERTHREVQHPVARIFVLHDRLVERR